MSKDTTHESERVADPEETSRRDIVLGVITVGAAGAALVVGAEAEAQGVSTAPGGLTAAAPGRRHYQVAFTRAPSLQELQASLGRMVGLAGCPTCGLVGFDLRLRIDPRFQGQPLGDIARYG